LTGAGQIGFTILSLTVSLIAVLIPLLFMGGVIGRPVQRVCRHARDHDRAVRRRLPDPRADALARACCGASPSAIPAGFERISEGLFNRTLAAYEHGLRWVLRHQGLTLLVAALDPGPDRCPLRRHFRRGCSRSRMSASSRAISVADNSISYQAMAARQMALADTILKDADVVSLTSYVGIDGTNKTLNNGPLPDQSQADRRALAERRADRPAHPGRSGGHSRHQALPAARTGT